MADKYATEKQTPVGKAVSGPPADKAMSAGAPVRRCPSCGAPLAKYSGPSAHKLGRDECAACGAYFAKTE